MVWIQVLYYLHLNVLIFPMKSKDVDFIRFEVGRKLLRKVDTDVDIVVVVVVRQSCVEIDLHR